MGTMETYCTRRIVGSASIMQRVDCIAGKLLHSNYPGYFDSGGGHRTRASREPTIDSHGPLSCFQCAMERPRWVDGVDARGLTPHFKASVFAFAFASHALLSIFIFSSNLRIYTFSACCVDTQSHSLIHNRRRAPAES